MLLRNFYKMVSQFVVLGDRNTNWTVKLPNGNTDSFYSTSNYALYSFMASMANSENSNGIHLGSGTTPPTLDDYKLESRIANNKFSASVSRNVTVVGSNIECVSTITITNTSSSTLTIGEIGLGMFVSGGSTSYVYPMVDRTVLDTPLVLEPTEVGQLVYTISHTSEA